MSVWVDFLDYVLRTRQNWLLIWWWQKAGGGSVPLSFCIVPHSALPMTAHKDARSERAGEIQVQHPQSARSLIWRTVFWCASEHLPWENKALTLSAFRFSIVLMEFPTVPSEDFQEVYSVSATPYLNATFSGDLLNEPSKSNETSGVVTRNTKGLIIAVCITALYSLICVVGLLGNVLVMYGVIR